ncbi:PAS domain-containing protein [uncultured Phenylobacterium sp.]|uniref:PAS domain-containing protein n=1 Tax=uncultured Phenylobacterium sp. TaxID=349273 RepID=UPI0025F2981F|nr:PAS domain-containing protein [uncultured Phenylobacterium sp.]
METDLSRLLDALPGMVWTATPDGKCNFVNRRWREYTGLTLDGVRAAGWAAIFHPEDVAAAMSAWTSTLATSPPAEIHLEARLRRADGVYRRFKLETRPLHDAEGRLTGWCGANADIEDRTRAEAQLAAEKRLLELVARGVPLPDVLKELALQVETLSPGSFCSILLVDAERHRFRVGAGASLPADYNAILDGKPIDPYYGPCSLAVETRQPVVVIDPRNDGRWRAEDWPATMARLDLVSCWSAPIFSSQNEVLGIFAIYRREPTGPTDEEQELIDRFTKIAGIGIERAQSDIAIKAAEADLRRSNRFLNGAQRLSQTGSFSLDTSTDEQVWSDENYRIWEFDPAVAPTMEMAAKAIHPDDRAEILATFAATTAAREDFEVSYRIVTPKGGVKYLKTVMAIVPEFSDRVVYLGSSQDVTQSKLAEEALKASETGLVRANMYLTAAQRLSKTGSYTWGVETGELDWSDESYRIWGIDPTRTPEMSMVLNGIHPEDRESTIEALNHATLASADFEMFHRIITPEGVTKHVHSVATRMPDITGRSVYVGSIQDITESRIAEEALKASEADLRRANRYLAGAQRLSKTGSFTWDVETGAQDWSEELYRIWEMAPEDDRAVPTLHATVVHPDDKVAVEAIMAKSVAAGESYEISYRIVTPSGKIKHLHTVNERLGDVTDRPVYVGATQDLTASKLGEQALRTSEARLRRANRYLKAAQTISRVGSFTWDIEHDELDWSDENYRIWEVDPASTPTTAIVVGAIHPEDVEAVQSLMSRARETGGDFELVYRIVTPKGTIKHLQTIATLTPDFADRVVYIGTNQDVTESKLAEAALRASETAATRANKYLTGAQALSRTGSFTWDAETNEQDWSAENYRIWELDPDVDPTMEMVLDRVHSEDRESAAAAMSAGRDTGADYEVFYRIVTPTGGVKHLHTVGTRAQEIRDRIVYVGSTQDVTASKLAESELARTNAYLTAAQRLSRTGSYTWDVAAEQQDWSAENFRIWEFDPATTPTMAMVLGRIHPEDRERAAASIVAGANTGEDFEVHYRIVTPSGAVKHLHTVSTRVKEIADRLVYIGSTQDVTASKLAEADLARANTYLTAAQRLSQTGSFTWDVEADAHNWSEVIYRIFGYEPGTAITMDMMMGAIHPDDLLEVQTLLGGATVGENFDLVFRVVTPNGDIRHAHVVGHRIDQFPDRPVFMGALQDITARKIAEDDLNRARAELAHVARAAALSTLTASIAHEVSQPLAGILTNASTTQRMLTAEPPNLEGAQATVQRTLRDADRASEVIKRLRALFSRQLPSFEPVDLHDAAREVLALSASELQRRRVILRTEFTHDPPLVQADRIQLQQVILNLILNAADAMSTISDRPRELWISTRRADAAHVHLHVRDAGIGIDPATAAQLFEAFHTTKPEGMGIGLSISRSIVEAHGGRLSAAPNDTGPGATFSFFIPCDAPSATGSVTGKRNVKA